MNETVLDRLAIIDIVNSVATGADQRRWDDVRACFADTVDVDYTSLNGGAPQQLPADRLLAGWRSTLPGFDATQHSLSNHMVTVEGDTAGCFAYVHARHTLANTTGGQAWTLGGSYSYRLQRMPGGWKITAISFTVVWAEGNQQLAELARARVAQENTYD